MAQRDVSEPERFDGFAMAAMKLVRAVEAQRLLQGAHPALAYVDAGFFVPRDGKSDHIGHRAAADESSARGGGKADHLLAPVHHLLVHQGRGVIAAAEVRALDRRKEIAQSAGEVAGAHVPRPEARMDIAHRIAHHGLAERLVDVRERLGFARQRRGEPGPHLGGHFPPHRAIADAFQISDGILDDPMRQRQRLAPILGVERLLGRAVGGLFLRRHGASSDPGRGYAAN